MATKPKKTAPKPAAALRSKSAPAKSAGVGAQGATLGQATLAALPGDTLSLALQRSADRFGQAMADLVKAQKPPPVPFCHHLTVVRAPGGYSLFLSFPGMGEHDPTRAIAVASTTGDLLDRIRAWAAAENPNTAGPSPAA